MRVKYEVSISCGLKVMAKVKVFCHRQTGQKLNAPELHSKGIKSTVFQVIWSLKTLTLTLNTVITKKKQYQKPVYQNKEKFYFRLQLDMCLWNTDAPWRQQSYNLELDMCLWNTDAPGGNKVKIWQKSLSPTFWPHPTPGEWDVSEVWGTLRWTYSPNFVTVFLPKL